MIDIKSTGISVVGAISTLNITKPSVLHTLLDSQVDDSLFFAVIYTGQSRQIALAIYDLHLVDHIRRQILGSHFRVVTEKLLAIYKNFRNSFASRSNLSV